MRLPALSPVLCLAAAPVAGAPDLPDDLPDDLLFQGRPLDPMCLTGFQEEPEVALPVCTDGADILRVDPAEPLRPDAEGWIGYGFKYADMSDMPGQAWAGWRYLGRVDRGVVVETRFSGGGTGWFTAVRILRREGEAVRLVDTLAGGDRCNGGVAGAAVVGGNVLTASNLTPYDLVAWALEEAGGPALPDMAPLDFCAICCVGTATYVDDAPAWVTLTPPMEGFAQSEDDALRVCLDGLLEEQAWPGAVLDMAALAAFGRTFRDRCLGAS